MGEPLAPDGGPWANYLGHSIGRYTESEGGDSPETQNAREGLFVSYDAWVDAGRPTGADVRMGDDELDRSERDGRR